MTFTQSEVRSYYAIRVPSLNLTTHREWRGKCPVHQGTNPNFAVNSETGLAQCHSQCQRGWDLISLEQELSGVDFPRAKEKVYEIVGRPKVPWEERDFQSVYDYTDEAGKLLYQVIRKVGKKFVQRRPDNGGWIWGLGETKRVPYRLEKIRHAEFCGIVEGEKDVLSLERIGMVATCNNGGAGNFQSQLAQYFANKHVAIFPDNDEPGREHAVKVAEILAPVAKSLKIVELPDLPPKGDVTDFVNAGGTVDQLRELYRKAQQWTPEWQFAQDIPDLNDKYVRTFSQEVEIAGGLEEFWNLSRLSGLETPWPKLSRAIGGGMRPGEVYVIGANQGAGKTSLALQFCMSAMRNNHGPLLFSMEMDHRAVFQRMASIEASVNLNELLYAQIAMRRKDLLPEDKIRAQEFLLANVPILTRQVSELICFPLLVSTKSSVTPEYIFSETSRLRRRQKIHLVIVDHMQLMGSEKEGRSEYEKFTAISRSMKQVAVDIGVPVLLVSQTSRSQSKDKRAEMEVSDLRGSGAIEEDAAGVFLLYEDKDDRAAAMAEGNGSRYVNGPIKTILKIGKNRYGEQGRCFELQHTKSCTRFDMGAES